MIFLRLAVIVALVAGIFTLTFGIESLLTGNEDPYWKTVFAQCIESDLSAKECRCTVKAAKKHINVEIMKRYETDPYADGQLTEEEFPKMQKYYDEFHHKCLGLPRSKPHYFP